ncbi:MAG: homoserine dehydrogenase [Anaerolineae bacterium]|nr:homoserine dehydrogenase [Anaerolineae bacterium]
MTDVRLLLVGLGNLGRRFCEIVAEREALLAERYGLRLKLVGAADSRGAACDASGLDMATVAAIKRSGGTIGDYPGLGHPGWGAVDLVQACEADVLLEASPVNLVQGAEPALSCIRLAMRRRMHVVTPNKGPLVVAFRELHELARSQGVSLRYDGTVAGGAPALNVGCRDLRGARVRLIEGVPNLTTGFVMDLLADGVPWDEATAMARDAGVLEGDGAWDLEGWDAAAKLVILANAVMGADAHISDVVRAGVASVPVSELQAARERGERYRQLVRAEERPDGSWALSALPTPLGLDHALGHLGSKQMGVVYTSDIYGAITLVIDEREPIPSAATMLRDLLDIYVDDSLTLVI